MVPPQPLLSKEGLAVAEWGDNRTADVKAANLIGKEPHNRAVLLEHGYAHIVTDGGDGKGKLRRQEGMLQTEVSALQGSPARDLGRSKLVRRDRGDWLVSRHVTENRR